MDCFANQIKKTNADKLESLGWDRINPATGPISIAGMQLGDTLKVTMKKIQINDTGL
jgi:amidase